MKFIKDTIRFLRVLALRGVASARRRELCAAENRPVLILAPHPDDEILGCAGLIARLVRLGNAPEVVILSGGGGSHRGCCDLDEDTLIAQRRNLTLKAAEAVGLPEGHIHFLDFTDGSISSEDAENFRRLKEIFDRVKPAAVFVPHSGEGWPDHLAARRMGLELADELTEGLAIYEYCVWMWYYNVRHLDWRNALTLKMTREEHSRKLAAMNIYTKALAPCGKPWSGVLPPVFLRANRWHRELYFKVTRFGNSEHKKEAS